MPMCLTCGVEDVSVTECRMCGETFCAVCGSADEELCTYCLENYDSFNENQRRSVEVVYSKFNFH